eukprot:scaffold549_cov117-Isochrysis_galbana.AAC.7
MQCARARAGGATHSAKHSHEKSVREVARGPKGELWHMLARPRPRPITSTVGGARSKAASRPHGVGMLPTATGAVRLRLTSVIHHAECAY